MSSQLCQTWLVTAAEKKLRGLLCYGVCAVEDTECATSFSGVGSPHIINETCCCRGQTRSETEGCTRYLTGTQLVSGSKTANIMMVCQNLTFHFLWSKFRQLKKKKSQPTLGEDWLNWPDAETNEVCLRKMWAVWLYCWKLEAHRHVLKHLMSVNMNSAGSNAEVVEAQLDSLMMRKASNKLSSYHNTFSGEEISTVLQQISTR